MPGLSSVLIRPTWLPIQRLTKSLYGLACAMTLFLATQVPLADAATSEATTSDTTPDEQPEHSSISSQEAARFLNQASFGPDSESLASVRQLGIAGWLDQQLALPLGPSQLNRTIEIALMSEPQSQWFTNTGFIPPRASPMRMYQNAAWWQQALSAPDQLRQRVAFALSEILVVSAHEGFLNNRAEALASWQDMLLSHAFGNYRELLSAVSYSPAMGVYLSHHGNRKANPARQTSPDENYARELMQLFAIGLYQINPDGSIRTDSKGQPVPVYTQQDVMELARVFTGWDMVGNPHFGAKGLLVGNAAVPMEFTDKFHDDGAKTLLGKNIPAGLGGKEDVEAALDILFARPEVGPFISRQLIQRLVSSNPSPAYVRRVSQVFDNNGQGVKGDLTAVIKAIYLDPEARNASATPVKLREPVIAMASLLRALHVQPAEPFLSRQKALIHDVYWVQRLPIGQNPLDAPSVFNFFEPDYQPVADGFRNTSDVAPEAAILDLQSLSGFNNLLDMLLTRRDIARRPFQNASFTEAVRNKDFGSQINVVIDTRPFNQLLELYLEKDSNGDFATLNNPAFKLRRHEALARLLDELQATLLSVPLGKDARQALLQHLQGPVIFANNPPMEANRLVRDSIRLLVMSPEYWVQR
jgi:uncharacterized protein (DUF1800 family)